MHVSGGSTLNVGATSVTLPIPALSTFTTFFSCSPGSGNVIGHFEDGASFTSGDCFMNRLPADARTGSVVVRASVSGGACGSAIIEFAAPEALVAYLRDGTQGGFVDISPTLVSGVVTNMPTTFYTGGYPVAANKGWVLSNAAHNGQTCHSCKMEQSFASSYNYNSFWDYCNSNPNTGGELVTLSATLPFAPPSPPPLPPTLPPMFTTFFSCSPGSGNVIGHFEDGASFTSGDCFMNRLPADARTGSVVVRASVSGGACGSAIIEFAAPEALVAYLRDGTQGGFVDISPTLVSGVVTSMPQTFYTGDGSNNKGFVIGHTCTGGCQFANSFASSYNYNSLWDYCNSNPNTGGELVTLKYSSLE